MDDWCQECQQVTYAIDDTITGDTICTECGLIKEEKIADNWSFSSHQQQDYNDPFLRSMEASNPILRDTKLDLGTVARKDSHSFDFVQESVFGELNTQNQCLSPYEDNLRCTLEKIDEIGEVLGLESVHISLAHEISRIVHDNKTINSKSRDAFAAACVFLSCKENKFPQSINKIASGCDSLSITKLMRAITAVNSLWNKAITTSAHREKLCPRVYMPRICSSMQLPREVADEANRISIVTEELDLRRSPITIAAAIVYFVHNVPRENIDRALLHTISNATGVSSNTIRKAFKDLLVHEALLLQHQD